MSRTQLSRTTEGRPFGWPLVLCYCIQERRGTACMSLAVTLLPSIFNLALKSAGEP